MFDHKWIDAPPRVFLYQCFDLCERCFDLRQKPDIGDETIKFPRYKELDHGKN